MDINDNNAEDRNEEALLELERYNSEQEKERLKDHEKEYNPRFEKPAVEEEGDLEPITVKEQAKRQTTGKSNQYQSFMEWRNMEDGEQKEALKTSWYKDYYNMTPEEYRNANFFQQLGAGFKNQKAGWDNPSGAITAMAAGAVDFPLDVGSISPPLGAIDEWWDRKTKFNDPNMQRWRGFGNVVIPTMVGSGMFLQASKGMHWIKQGAGLLGIDLAVTGFSEDQTKQDSWTRAAVDTWPGQFGPGGRTPLPKSWVTHDHMSPMNRKIIHMIEATPFALVGNALGFMFSEGKEALNWFKPLNKVAKKYKAMEVARGADNQISIRIAEIDQTLATKPNPKDIKILKEERKRLITQLGENNRFDQFVENAEQSKASQADAAGADKARNPNNTEFDPDITPTGEPVTGYNSIPEGSAARNMAEVTAIKNGNAPSDSLPPPILTENQRRKALRVSGKESPARTTIMDIEAQARAMGDFEVISDGITYSRKAMDKAAEKIFVSIMEAGDVADIQKAFLSERSVIKLTDDLTVKIATEPQARAAYWAIRELFDRYIGGPVARASARYMDTTGREIAATAQAMNEFGGELVDDIKQTDLILGKLQFLLTEWGTNAKVGSAILKLKDASRTGPGFVEADELLPHMLKEFKAIENGAHAKAVRFTKELRQLAIENPLAVKPLIHIFEYTNGDVDTMIRLSKWASDRVDIRGLILSPDPGQMNYMAKGLWGVFFNNMLSGLAPLNALKGNVSMQIAKPLNQLLGSGFFSIADGSLDEFKKVLSYHSSVVDTNRKALNHAWNVMKKVHTDPTSHLDSLRADFVIKARESDSILEEMGEVWKAKGDLGHTFQYNMAKTFHELYQMKWFRTGMTGMSFVDGMTDIHSATWISKLEAIEDAIEEGGGVATKEAIEKAFRVNYAKKFDKNGILKDGPAKADASEIKFNINDGLAKAINNVTNTVPPLKHLFTFPRAVSNAMKVTFSYTPIGAIPGATKYADTIWARTDDQIKAALMRHDIDPTTTPHWRQVWKVKRSEYVGRLIMGQLITRGLWEWALDGGVNGPGHFNPSRRQREMKYYGYKPQTIKIPIPGKDNDILMSYKGIPGIETILDLVGSMAYYARDIEQPLYEDTFRKISITMALSLGDQTFFSGIDKLFDAMNGNEAAMKRWVSQSIPIIPSGVKLLAKSIDAAYKDIYNDLTDYYAAQLPIVSKTLPDEVSPFDAKPVGTLDNKIADAIMAYSPIKFYPEADNTPVGKVQSWLREINYEGMTRITKDTSGKIEWTNEERQRINRYIGEQNPWKDIAKIMKKPKYKYIAGKVRAFIASGQSQDWDRVEFKEELMQVYDEIDQIWDRALANAEQRFLDENPGILNIITRQALMDKYIQQGRIDDAVTEGNKAQELTENLLQMAK